MRRQAQATTLISPSNTEQFIGTHRAALVTTEPRANSASKEFAGDKTSFGQPAATTVNRLSRSA